MAKADPCPNCQGKLQYLIALDQYRCVACRNYFDVYDVENTHHNYAPHTPRSKAAPT